MDLTLLVLFILIVIGYVWYVTKYHKYHDDDVILDMSSDDNNLFSTNKIENESLIDNRVVAADFINKLWKLKVDYTKIAVAEDMSDRYYEVSGKLLKGVVIIRDIIGLPGEIAIIHNSKIRKALHDKNFNMSTIKKMIDDDVLINLSVQFEKVLKYRWEKIENLSDIKKINKYGSYLYVKDFDFENIKAHTKKNCSRINLLCSNYEFNNFISRISKKALY